MGSGWIMGPTHAGIAPQICRKDGLARSEFTEYRNHACKLRNPRNGGSQPSAQGGPYAVVSRRACPVVGTDQAMTGSNVERRPSDFNAVSNGAGPLRASASPKRSSQTARHTGLRGCVGSRKLSPALHQLIAGSTDTVDRDLLHRRIVRTTPLAAGSPWIPSLDGHMRGTERARLLPAGRPIETNTRSTHRHCHMQGTRIG